MANIHEVGSQAGWRFAASAGYMLSWSNRLKQEERYEQDRCANNQDHNEQSKSSRGSSARESQAAGRTTVVDRRGTLMQHRECQRENENERDWIREVALAEQMNTRGTALRAIHHRILADSAPTSNETEMSCGERERASQQEEEKKS
jgi:hypothetical protein